MNAIVGFTDIAMKRKPDKEVEDCLKKIRQSSEYLMTLINDVLDISRIESGKLEYKPVLVDLRDMTDTVLSIASGYMETQNQGSIAQHYHQCSQIYKRRRYHFICSRKLSGQG